MAEQARGDEQARQARIRDGMAAISRAFDGSLRGVGAATSFDPNGSYFNADGSAFSQSQGFGGFDSTEAFSGMLPNSFRGGGARRRETPEELIQQGRLFTGTGFGGGFNEEFYKKRAQDYSNFATPQLERQAADAREKMIFALSRTGNLQSSAAIDKSASLNQDVNEQRIGIANQGIDNANQTRSQVENIRSNVVGELNATGDNTAAANSAVRQAENLNATQGYSPLANLFGTFTTALAGIGSNAGNGFSGFAGGRALFGQGRGSQRVVGG